MKKKPMMPKTSKKMSMASYEKSPMDMKMDKKQGFKEGSKKEKAADAKELAAINKKKK